MTTQDFLIIFAGVALLQLVCRVAPVFLLKGKQLPPAVVRALNFIPPAAFAALVTNDLFNPTVIASGNLALWLPALIAAAITMAVGLKTKSLALCVVVGVGSLAALQFLPL